MIWCLFVIVLLCLSLINTLDMIEKKKENSLSNQIMGDMR